jgi:hypothetical protein
MIGPREILDPDDGPVMSDSNVADQRSPNRGKAVLPSAPLCSAVIT